MRTIGLFLKELFCPHDWTPWRSNLINHVAGESQVRSCKHCFKKQYK